VYQYERDIHSVSRVSFAAIRRQTSPSKKAGGLAQHFNREVPRTAFKIAFQIVDIFEADMQTQSRALRVPDSGCSCSLAIERHDQAFKAAPGVAHAKDAERVQHPFHRRAGAGLQIDREKSARAKEITAPQLMARMAGRAGCTTDATSGRACSHSAIARPDLQCRSSRTERVRSPRRARKQSSPLTQRPRLSWVDASALADGASQVIAPRSASAWPTMYFVAAWIEIFTPWSKARK